MITSKTKGITEDYTLISSSIIVGVPWASRSLLLPQRWIEGRCCSCLHARDQNSYFVGIKRNSPFTKDLQWSTIFSKVWGYNIDFHTELKKVECTGCDIFCKIRFDLKSIIIEGATERKRCRRDRNRCQFQGEEHIPTYGDANNTGPGAIPSFYPRCLQARLRLSLELLSSWSFVRWKDVNTDIPSVWLVSCKIPPKL